MKEYIIQAYDKETVDEFDRRNAPELVSHCWDEPGTCRYYVLFEGEKDG
jgi:hypothetical protein